MPNSGPEMDLVLYRFSSGVCWCLPVPSEINYNPPKPTPIVGTPSQASVAVGHKSGHLHTHTPILSLLGVAGCRSFMLEGSASCLSALRRRQKNPWASLFQRTFREEPFSPKFRNLFALQGTIKIKTKRSLWTFRGGFYPLRKACKLIRVMTAVHMSTQGEATKRCSCCSSLKWCSLDWLTRGLPDRENSKKEKHTHTEKKA